MYESTLPLLAALCSPLPFLTLSQAARPCALATLSLLLAAPESVLAVRAWAPGKSPLGGSRPHPQPGGAPGGAAANHGRTPGSAGPASPDGLQLLLACVGAELRAAASAACALQVGALASGVGVAERLSFVTSVAGFVAHGLAEASAASAQGGGAPPSAAAGSPRSWPLRPARGGFFDAELPETGGGSLCGDLLRLLALGSVAAVQAPSKSSRVASAIVVILADGLLPPGWSAAFPAPAAESDIRSSRINLNAGDRASQASEPSAGAGLPLWSEPFLRLSWRRIARPPVLSSIAEAVASSQSGIWAQQAAGALLLAAARGLANAGTPSDAAAEANVLQALCRWLQRCDGASIVALQARKVLGRGRGGVGGRRGCAIMS